MLRQVFILKGNEIFYQRMYGNAIKNPEIEDLSFKIIAEAKRKLGKTTGYFDYIKYRIAYDVELEYNLTFIFITGLMDDFYRLIKIQLANFKNQFLSHFGEELKKKNLEGLDFKGINVMLDEMHRNLKPKIAVVGFAGVGKTTIKKLIKMDEIPLLHVPTITGDIATIKIGKLFFRLFDFAGQEQFKYLWKTFIKESDAVLVVTDSTIKNVEKSKFFLDLKTKEVPHARATIIGNKQDLPNAMSVEEIEAFTGLKTYPMVANRKENRNKMIRIIADVLDMSTENSPLLAELFESTDLSYETLFGIGEKSAVSEELATTENQLALTTGQTENDAEISNMKERIGQIISQSMEVKPLILKKEYAKQEKIKFPIENALITSELYNELLNNNSFTLDEILSILFTISNCVFLTKTNPEEFPKFGTFLKQFKMDIFNSKEISTIRKYYSKVLKQIKT